MTPLFDIKKVCVLVLFLLALPGGAKTLDSYSDPLDDSLLNERIGVELPNNENVPEESVVELEEGGMAESNKAPSVNKSIILPEHLGPVLVESEDSIESQVKFDSYPSILQSQQEVPWKPSIAPLLDVPVLQQVTPVEDLLSVPKPNTTDAPKKVPTPAKMLAVDVHPKMPQIAILIDDLGYSRDGMESSLLLPTWH
jgi:uncharacterized protein